MHVCITNKVEYLLHQKYNILHVFHYLNLYTLDYNWDKEICSELVSVKIVSCEYLFPFMHCLEYSMFMNLSEHATWEAVCTVNALCLSRYVARGRAVWNVNTMLCLYNFTITKLLQ